MTDKILNVTKTAPYIRFKMNVNNAFNHVLLALIPIAIFGCYNIGRNAFIISQKNSIELEGARWRILEWLKLGADSENIASCFVYGIMYFLPLFLISFVVGKIVEIVFAKIRHKEIGGGILLTSLLFTLTLPPSLPIWQAGVGMLFGIFVGRELFGGLGKNFMNPALTARAFVFFSYPANFSGNTLWSVIDSYTGATALSLSRNGGLEALNMTWQDAFLGNVLGSIGETSALLCLIAGVFLMFTRIINWRIVFGVIAGVIVMSGLFNIIAYLDGDILSIPVKPVFLMSWRWHIVLGGLAFGTIFMATDPVSSCQTNKGRLFYGIFIGCMTIIIRATSTSFYEGIMLAILLGNICAPVIDYIVIRKNIKKRQKRYELLFL